MPARAMWKAELVLADERVPIKLYAAVQDRSVHFRLLHAQDHQPVAQQMVDPSSDEPVAKEDIQRGVQVAPGVLVVLSEDERKELEPAPSRSIHVEQCVTADQIDTRWFDRPYYLGPDGDDDSYLAVIEALAKRKRIGIARWVMRGKAYHGALLSEDGFLVLQTLRYAEQMVSLDSVRPAAGRSPDPRERKMAAQLIEALADSFDPSDYRDEHREQLMELIEAKAEGRDIELPDETMPEAPASLLDSLKDSLSAAREAHGG